MRSLLCDFDGVIRHWDPEDTLAIEERHGLAAGSIGAAAFALELGDQVILGRIDDAAWRARVGQALAGQGPAAARAVAEWAKLIGRIDPDVMAVIAELRAAGGRTALVSNATTRLEADLAALGLDGAFDAVISSARVELCKPDPRIYRLAAERLDVPPEDCVFVDDTPGHVEAARAIGMTGILFAGAADLRAQLFDVRT